MEVFLRHYRDDFPQVDIPTCVKDSYVIRQGVQYLWTIEFAQHIERDVFRNLCENKVPIALELDNSTVSLTNTSFVDVLIVGRVPLPANTRMQVPKESSEGIEVSNGGFRQLTAPECKHLIPPQLKCNCDQLTYTGYLYPNSTPNQPHLTPYQLKPATPHPISTPNQLNVTPSSHQTSPTSPHINAVHRIWSPSQQLRALRVTHGPPPTCARCVCYGGCRCGWLHHWGKQTLEADWVGRVRSSMRGCRCGWLTSVRQADSRKACIGWDACPTAGGL
jgi:hypothetical protein